MSDRRDESDDDDKRSRGICFTINNWTDADVEALTESWMAKPKKTWMIVSAEVAPTTGTKHLQCAIFFKDAQKFNAVHKIVPRASCKMCSGSATQNQAYCSKEGSILFEAGEPPKSSKEKGAKEKARWDEARNAALEGRIEDVPSDIFIRHYGTLTRIQQDYRKAPASIETMDHHWWWGAPGTGKSKLAREKWPVFYAKNTNKWWCGYKGEDTILIEDVGINDAKWIGDFLKRWADHYAFRAETKGGSMMIRPKSIVVTSNYSMEQLFGSDPEGLLNPLKRRFASVQFHKSH